MTTFFQLLSNVAMAEYDEKSFDNLVEEFKQLEIPDVREEISEFSLNYHILIAARKGLFSIAKFLLTQIENIEVRQKFGSTPFHLATQNKNIELLREFLRPSANNEPSVTSLDAAVYKSLENTIQLLLAIGVNIDTTNDNGNTALHFAVSESFTGYVKLLYKYGANVEAKNNDGITPLLLATNLGHTDIVKSLLEYGADVKATEGDARMPIHIAARGGKEDIVSLLLENGADIHDLNILGWTPLHFAASRGAGKVIELLLQKGANIEAKSNAINTDIFIGGSTPLFIAVRCEQESITKLLLSKGADINTTDNNGLSLLHQAVLIDEAGIAQILLENGTDIEAIDNQGDTPLHLTLFRNNNKILELLFKHSKPANIFAKNKEGKTPLDMMKPRDSIEEEIIDIMNLHYALIKCIQLIPSPWAVDAPHSLHPDMVLKIAALWLQNNIKIKVGQNAEGLIFEMASKRNMGILKAFLLMMSEQIAIPKNAKGKKRNRADGAEVDSKAIYQKLSEYSQDFYFFSRKQRESFVKEMLRKDLSEESIEEAIEAAKLGSVDMVVGKFDRFTLNEMQITPQA